MNDGQPINSIASESIMNNDAQYQRLIEARNFHYENFNKWSLYFYAIIAALFVGYYHISAKSTSSEDNTIVLNGIMILGYIVSICCYLSGRGYYYWELNWIMKVQEYEKNHLGSQELKIYSTFADVHKLNRLMNPIQSANVSSSKLALVVSFSVACAWGYLFIASVFSDCICISCPTEKMLFYGFWALFITYLISIVGAVCFPSDMSPFEGEGDLRLLNKK